MKNYFVFVLLFTASVLRGQEVFRHVATANNIQGHITIIDHPKLNNNPNAVIFIMPNHNQNGTDVGVMDYSATPGVWYNGSKWTIFNEKTSTPMPQVMTFNVLIAPPNNPNYFTVSATKESIAANGFPNGFVINNVATNGKTNALLLVTQNRANAYNDNTPITSYANGTWRISNNGYFNAGSSQQSFMPPGAQFNVMVIENGIVPSVPNSTAFKQIATTSNIIPSGKGITFLDKPSVNGNINMAIFATAYWGHGDADRGNDPTKAGGPYNESPFYAWYDHPNDIWHYKDKYWSIHNATIKPMPIGAKFHVVAAAVNYPAAPVLVSPACGSVFSNFPRTTTLKWQPIGGAVSYTVEVDCYHCCTVGKWCTEVGQPLITKAGLTTPNYTFDFAGANKGRWRVWAVYANGTLSAKSNWCEFTYTK